MGHFASEDTRQLKLWTWTVGLCIFFVLWLFPLFLGKYACIYYEYLPSDAIVNNLVKLDYNSSPAVGGHLCPQVSENIKKNFCHAVSSLHMENATSKFQALKPGGVWAPAECTSRYQVVLIVPYRDRPEQLNKFVHYMHGFLQKQQIEYRIVIVEQADESPFNRAKLFNIGFLESQNLSSSLQCFIFHDVDLIPLCDMNIYACSQLPRHMSSSIDVFRFLLPYKGLFGGAVSMTSHQMRMINGFSNAFYGWGGEDDDIFRRLSYASLKFVRFDPSVSRYTMLPHRKQGVVSKSASLLQRSASHFSQDGLNSCTYKLTGTEYRPLYTLISVVT